MGLSIPDLAGGIPRSLGFEPSNTPFIGGLFNSPAQEMQQAQFANIAKALEQYRPQVAQAQSQALGNSLASFVPANNMLGQMYGPGAMIDFNTIAQSPVTQAMTQTAPEKAKKPKQPKGPLAGVTDKIPGGDLIEQPFSGPFGPLQSLAKMIFG